MVEIHICTICDGGGFERRLITNPQANVCGWYREQTLESWYRRTCPNCRGEGFIQQGPSTVPLVKVASK